MRILSRIVATLLVVAGLAAFLVPLGHPGPYGIPGRGLAGGLLGLALAGLLLTSSVPKALRVVALLASPVVLFLALYGAMAELEEVVVLHAGDAELRLWIVDHEGVPWVSMPREKAVAHGLDGGRFDLLRAGEVRCVAPRLFDDPVSTQRTFDLRQEKYAVQRFAGLIGMYGESPNPGSITLRLDPCDGAGGNAS